MQAHASFHTRTGVRWFTTLFCFAILFLFTTRCNSQTAGTANIQGTVTDATGALIQNATVTITENATGVQHKTTTGEDGLYSFPNVSIGTYTLSISAPGFKRYSQAGIVLEVGSNIGINVSMTIGETSQSVQVQANGLALQTEDPSFKQTIDQKTVTELPLNGRQMTSLIILSGGAAPTPNNDMVGSKNFYSSVAISIAGGQGNATDYRLDGGDHNDYMTNVNLPFPFPDAVSQFSVETSALGAQSGLHPGGLVNVVTRSGSNEWHGSAFEFIRNNYIDATNFFSTTKDTLHQNQYGGTLGGKIIRDRLFFFGGYQHTKADQSQALTQAFVPTAANLNGDFSITDGAGCQSGGQNNPLLNPQTGAVLPNNQISTSYFSPAALALVKYLPTTTDPCGTVNYAIPSQQSENQIIARVDAILTQKHSLYGSYFLDGYNSPAYFSPTNVLLTTQPGNQERVQTLTIGETYIINSNTVNSFHATGTRRRDNRGPAAEGISPATFNISSYSPIPNFLELTVGSGSGNNKWTTYCGTCAPASFNVNAFSFTDDVNMVRGKHQIAFGGEYVRAQFNANNAYETNGNFGVSGAFSQKGPAGNSKGGAAGDANLDFLTGALHSYEQSKAQQNALRAPIPSLYIQDTYHATSRLVLSAGLRWDPEYMPVDYFHRGAVFNYGDFENNVHSTVFPNAPAGIFFYGDAGVLAAFTKNSPWQFSPRLGLAFDPMGDGKTVFRAGVALIYDEPNFFTGQRVNQNPPFASAVSNVPVNVPLNFASPWTGGTTPGNPFPLPFKPPTNQVFPNQAQYIVLPTQFHPAYTTQWTFSVQHELSRGWQFQVDYIGNKSTHVAYGYPINPAVYIPGTCNGNPCSTTGNQSARFVLTRANPSQGPKFTGGGGGSVLVDDGANANYNGMVATIQHRMSSTFSFLANYTWSHCIDIEDAQGDFAGTTVENPNNINMDRASCGFDYRQIYNTTVVAASHFHLTGWKDQVVNNWEIAPLLHITSAAPFTVTSGFDYSLTDVNNDRPNVINPNGVYTHRTITQSSKNGNRNLINLAAFAPNAPGTYGSSGRNAYRGFNFVQVDSQLSRTFPLKERLALELRFEAFNVLNHPNFNNPGASTSTSGGSTNTAINSGTFGQITTTNSGYGARIFQGAVKIVF